MLSYREDFGASAYVNRALNVYDYLARQSDLSPRNSTLNTILYAFVRDTMRLRPRKETAAILTAPAVREVASDLRRLLGQAEFEMECFSTNAMLGKERKAEERYASFPNFIYRGNYDALIRSELRALKWHVKQPPLNKDRESVAFVGAGPLPISAIMFYQRTGLPVTCIDSDERACTLGRRLIMHLAANDPGYKGIDKKIHYVHAEGAKHDYVTHPLVFIASLVERKDPVVMQIVRTSHTAATTVIRSAEGLATLLYKSEECVGGKENYNVYLTSQSYAGADAINTSLVYKFPPGKCWMRNKIEWEGWAPDDINLLKPNTHRVGHMRTRPYDTSI